MARAVRLAALAPLSALILSACGERQAPTQAPRQVDTLTESAPSVPLQSSTRWRLISSGEGTFIQRTDATGNIVLILGCTSAPPGLEIALTRVPRIASEDRVTLGFGSDLVTMVADLGRAGPGITARAPLESAFLDRLETASGISAVYGPNRVGPFGPPPADQLTAVLNSCRDILAMAPS